LTLPARIANEYKTNEGLTHRLTKAGILSFSLRSAMIDARTSAVEAQEQEQMTQTPAIDGGTPLRTTPFPEWPVYDEREERLLLEVLHSRKWGTITGDKVATFARAFAEFQGAQYGVCVPNGTLGLELALEALEIGPGDEVITTPYTFIATASAVLTAGARPVFVDVNPKTYNIDAERIEHAITPRTKAIIPVHLGGQPADLDAVRAIAKKHELRVLEDACQAWGAQWNGQGVGALGDLGCFSFQASKNITSGEGGILLTNNPNLYARAWSLHNVGRIPDGEWYQHEILGRNLRMSEWEGAVLLAQLERLPEHMAIRDINARALSEMLANEVEGIVPETVDPRVTRHAHHLLLMNYQAEAFGGKSRDEFVRALHAEGISPISTGYVPLHHSPAIRKTLGKRFGIEQAEQLPVVEKMARETVWLNQTALIGGEAELESIVGAMKKLQRAWG
jgi:dTDP-4-amino-4,6-dideoxygalactose transaminase